MSHQLYVPGKSVYVAGPYSAPTEALRVCNVNCACVVARRVMALGYVPFVPHTSHYIDPKNDLFPYDRWMEWRLHWLERCDILLVTGLSKGVRIEIDFAIKNGIPICWSLAELEWRHEEEQNRAGVSERTAEPARQAGFSIGGVRFCDALQALQAETVGAPTEEEKAAPLRGRSGHPAWVFPGGV